MIIIVDDVDLGYVYDFFSWFWFMIEDLVIKIGIMVDGWKIKGEKIIVESV